MQGGPPPAPPAAPRGGRPISQEISKICGGMKQNLYPNVEAYGWSENETARKCILQAEKHYAWDKKNSEKNICFPRKNCFFSLRSKKTTIFPQETKVRLRVFLSLA